VLLMEGGFGVQAKPTMGGEMASRPVKPTAQGFSKSITAYNKVNMEWGGDMRVTAAFNAQ